MPRNRTTPPPPAWLWREDRLDALKLTPMAWLVGWAAAGCEPATMGMGPVPAVRRLFARTGLSFDDMDLIELNEAFAVQVLAVLAAWGWNDPDRLNVNGSGVSLGHPIGATGVRIMTTLLHELRHPAPRAATASRPCASVGARAWRRFSSVPRERLHRGT